MLLKRFSGIFSAAAISLMILSSISSGALKIEEATDTDHNLKCYKVTTPLGEFFYDKIGCGFSSFVDVEGNDWINYNKASGPAGRDRGFPNMGWQKANGGDGFGHPGYGTFNDDAGKSEITVEKADHIQVKSTKGTGWEVTWDFYETHVTQKIIKAKDFWWQYEGTPGGSLEIDKDYWVLSDKTSKKVKDAHKADLADPEWVFFVDPKLKRSLFFVHHNSHSTDKNILMMLPYAPSGPKMAVAGWGRYGSAGGYCCDKSYFYKTVPHTWSAGFVEDSTYSAVKAVVDAVVSGSAVTNARKIDRAGNAAISLRISKNGVLDIAVDEGNDNVLTLVNVHGQTILSSLSLKQGMNSYAIGSLSRGAYIAKISDTQITRSVKITLP